MDQKSYSFCLQVNPSAAFADAFDVKGAQVAKYIITIGALAGMLNNLVSRLAKGDFLLIHTSFQLKNSIFSFSHNRQDKLFNAALDKSRKQ